MKAEDKTKQDVQLKKIRFGCFLLIYIYIYI